MEVRESTDISHRLSLYPLISQGFQHPERSEDMRRFSWGRGGRRTAVVIALVVGVLGVGVASGVAVAATTGHVGTSVTRVSVATNDTAALFTGAAWTNGGSTSIFATAGQFITARFTAESACYGSTSGWCS